MKMGLCLACRQMVRNQADMSLESKMTDSLVINVSVLPMDDLLIW